MFAWGAIGGMLPTLGKVAGTFGANFDAPMPNLVGVSIALGLYAILGSIMARVIGNSDLKQAVVAGIAAPASIFQAFLTAGVRRLEIQHGSKNSTRNRMARV
jgi:hypothetical protein